MNFAVMILMNEDLILPQTCCLQLLYATTHQLMMGFTYEKSIIIQQNCVKNRSSPH